MALLMLLAAAGPERQDAPCPRPLMTGRVEAVVDGDTIRLAGGEKVRYLGIDTPEVHHPGKPVEDFGPEATEANRLLVEGRSVVLIFDQQERDRYGRLLAYVIVDDVFVNARLVREGHARVMTIPPNTALRSLFETMETEARASRKGIWSKEGKALDKRKGGEHEKEN